MKILSLNIIRQEAATEGGGAGGGSIMSGGEAPTAAPAVEPGALAPVAAEAAAAAAAPVVTFPDNWKDGLSEEIRSEASLGLIQDIPALAKSFVHAQKQIGRDKIVIPDKHATPEDWKNIFQKLGHPQELKGYEITPPEGANFDDGFVTQFKEQAFKHNILPHQANEILKWYSEANETALAGLKQEQANEQQTTLKKLKAEFGEAFQTKLQSARMAVKEAFGGEAEDVFMWLEESGLGNDERMIKMMMHFGQMIKEDTVIGDGRDNNAETPKAIEEQINEIMGNKEHPYYDKAHPNHAKAVKEMQTLHERMHGNGPAVTNQVQRTAL